MSKPALHVQMLGGFSLQLGEDAVGQIPARAASLLAYLILHRDREHTRDLLAGRFWSETTDDKARRGLSQALWRIGKSVRDKDDVQLLVATNASVQFNPDIDVVLDVETFGRSLDDFEHQLRSNRRSVQTSDLEAIVAGYRGTLLAGYYDDWIDDERKVLHDRYRAALKQLVSITSAEGDYDLALRHAQTLVADEPLDEEAQQEVLRLHALSGHPSAAERHYKQFTRDLKAQLGFEPSSETQELMRRILDDVSAPPVGFSDVEHEASALIGRGGERSALLNRVNDLMSGKGGLVLMEGEAGIGKSRLAEELARGAEWRGAQVLVGSHNETSWMTPYEGLKQALDPVTSGFRGERLLDTVGPMWLSQASVVLESLTDPIEESERQKLRPAEEPWRTSEALARIILAQGRPKPTVLILEDIHRCDEDTMLVLSQLGDRLIDSQVLICLTYQLHEVRQSDSIWNALSEIEAAAGSSRIVLSPLPDEDILDLINAEIGQGRMPATMASQLVKLTAGNPYVLLELLRSPLELLNDDAFEDPGREQLDEIETHLLPHLSDIIGRRLDAASDEVRAVVEGVAVLGVPARTSVIAQVAQLDRSTTLDALERAVDLGFLTETERGCDFEQAQTRRVIYQELAVDERVGLHRRIADALTVEGSGVDIEQIAHHAWLAGQWGRAHQFHSLAADSAVRINAFQTSAEHFSKADQAARSAGIADADRVDDLLDYEQILDVLGRRDEQEEVLDRLDRLDGIEPSVLIKVRQRRAWLFLNTDAAAQAVNLARDAAKLARSAGLNVGELLTIVGTALARTGQLVAALEPLTEAVAALQAEGRSASAAQMMLGRTHADLKGVDSAHRHLQDAYDEARSAGDARSQVEALGHIASTWLTNGVDPRAEGAYKEAIELAKEIGYRFGEGHNLINLAAYYAMSGRGGRSLRLLEEAAQVLVSLGNKRGEAVVKANGAWLQHWILGDDLAAKQQAEDAALQLRNFGDRRSEAECLHIVADIERRAGRRRHARKRLLHLLDRAGSIDHRATEAQVLINLALVELDLGNPEQALVHLGSVERLREVDDLGAFAAVSFALEAKARVESGDISGALQLTDSVIRANGPTAQLAHLAAWWCAEVFMAADDDARASEQVALAHKLLSRNLEELPEEVAGQSWDSVPEHKKLLAAWERFFVDRVEWQVPGVEAPTGRPLEEKDYVSVMWTRSTPNDRELTSSMDRRRHRILRLVAEAAEQGGAARQSDIAEALGVSERTVKRDLQFLRSIGHSPPTRRKSGENIWGQT